MYIWGISAISAKAEISKAATDDVKYLWKHFSVHTCEGIEVSTWNSWDIK